MGITFVLSYRASLTVFPSREEAEIYVARGKLEQNSIIVDRLKSRLYDKLWDRWARAGLRGYVYLSPIVSLEELDPLR